MNKSSFTSSSEPALRAAGFLGLAGAIYAALLAILHLDTREISIVVEQDKLARISGARALVPEPDIAIFGDSRALLANQSEAFAREHRVYNFGIMNPGGLYPYPYLFDLYLAHRKPPKRVLLSFIPEMLGEGLDIFRGGSPIGSAELYRSSRLYSLGNILSAPIFRDYPDVAAQLLYQKFTINRFYEKAYIPLANCYHPETGSIDCGGSLVWTYRPDPDRDNAQLEVSKNARRFLGELLTQARAAATRVHYHAMPIPAPILEARDRSGFLAQLRAVLESLEAEYRGTFSADPRPTPYPPELFNDDSHLNHAGAARFQIEEFQPLIERLARDTAQPGPPR